MTPHPVATKLRDELHAGSVRLVRLANAAELATLPPDKTICHACACAWVRQHPSSRVVEGWLVVNERLFHKHSVVTGGDGLLCVTPRQPGACENRFIVHRSEWTNEPFSALPAQVVGW